MAATRARNALIICDSIQGTKGGERHASAWSCLMEGDDPALPVGDDDTAEDPTPKEAVPAAELYDEAAEGCILKGKSMPARTYSVENPSRLRLIPKTSAETEAPGLRQDGEFADGQDKGPDAHMFPALLGTMVHKLMEMLVSAGNEADITQTMGEIIGEYGTVQTKPYEDMLSDALKKVAEKMRSGGYQQTNGLPDDILETLLGADEKFCEVPFCYAEDTEDGKKLWNGVIDAVYRTGEDWHIVDYKTNADGTDLDEKYSLQLQA